MTSDSQPTCFIIMPITTPVTYLEKYRDGKDHFKHILECLFIPSVEKAGYQAIPPIAQGSELIQAGIIEKLEQSDIVLCDMSCLNSNVFFEFGIRTALDKPVCIIKDELIENIPFDISILNCLTYNSQVEVWSIYDEIRRISDHIVESVKSSNNGNALWKYLGLKTHAKPTDGDLGISDQLSFISMRLDYIQKNLTSQKIDFLSEGQNLFIQEIDVSNLSITDYIFRLLSVFHIITGFKIECDESQKHVTILFERLDIPKQVLQILRNKVFLKYGDDVEFSIQFQNLR